MRIPRIYLDCDLNPHQPLELPRAAAQHTVKVLRRRPGDALIVFDGRGGEYPATVADVARGLVRIVVEDHVDIERESPLDITLAQGIARGERMDFTIQKAVELGVSAIVPVLTRRSTVRLDAARSEKRRRHWRAVIISACEQCGRNRLPALAPVQALEHWLPQVDSPHRWVLRGDAERGLPALTAPIGRITVLIGPEGGLDTRELAVAERAGFTPMALGPRILRTETAGLAALAAIQTRYGDFVAGPGAAGADGPGAEHV